MPSTQEMIAAAEALGWPREGVLQTIREAIGTIFSELGLEGQASGTGSLFRIHFRANPLTDHRSAYPTKTEESAIRRLHREYINRGIMVSANCSANVSTAISDADIDRFLVVTRDALAAVQSENAT
jgi:glutamate-1-semialdehyde 2,1-aminomutase